METKIRLLKSSLLNLNSSHNEVEIIILCFNRAESPLYDFLESCLRHKSEVRFLFSEELKSLCFYGQVLSILFPQINTYEWKDQNVMKKILIIHSVAYFKPTETRMFSKCI